MKKISSSKGFAPIIAVIVVIAIISLMGIGVGIYMIQSKKAAPATGDGSAAPQAVDEITVSAPDLEFSFSALPTLQVASLDFQVPQVSGTGIFNNFSVDTDFSPTVDTSLETPGYTFDVTAPPELGTRPAAPTQPNAPTPPPGGGTPTTDCSQFSSVPNCSYVGAPGSPGYEACKTCYPNK